MDNKVGLAPDAATTAKLLDKLRNVVATFRTYGITLSKDERRVLLHARLGAEPHIARIRDVAVKHGLSIPDVPLQGMMNDLELFTLLRPFQDAFARRGRGPGPHRGVHVARSPQGAPAQGVRSGSRTSVMAAIVGRRCGFLLREGRRGVGMPGDGWSTGEDRTGICG